MRNRPLFVGLLIAIAAAALVAAVVGLRHPRGPVIYAEVHAAPGLREGAAVSFRGIVVGRVAHIAFVPDGLRLTIALNRRDVPLRSGDGVRVRPNGILGDIALELVPGAGSAPAIGEGAVLHEAAVDDATLRRQAAPPRRAAAGAHSGMQDAPPARQPARERLPMREFTYSSGRLHGLSGESD